MLAYPVLNGAAKRYSTFSFDGALWSGKIDTPSGEFPFYDREQILAVDNTGSAALSGTCFKPGTGWSSVAVLKAPTNAGPLWSPCLESGGIAAWHDLVMSAGKSSTVVNWVAKIGAKGWSQEHVMTTDGGGKGEPIVVIHPGKYPAVVLYEKYSGIPESISLWAGRWTPPSNW